MIDMVDDYPFGVLVPGFAYLALIMVVPHNLTAQSPPRATVVKRDCTHITTSPDIKKSRPQMQTALRIFSVLFHPNA
jgi:hypothetical protein